MDEPRYSRIAYRRMELALTNEQLINAFDLIQAGVEANEELLAASLADAVANDPDADLNGWDDDEQIEFRKKVHGQTLYRALFLSTWGTLEQFLRDLCRDLKADCSLTLSERDLAGRGVRRSLKYIRKVAGVGIDLNSVNWQLILKYGHLRNHLAHVGSNADEAHNPGKARSVFGDIPHVIVEPAGEIVLDPGFIPRAMVVFNKFLKAVIEGAGQLEPNRG